MTLTKTQREAVLLTLESKSERFKGNWEKNIQLKVSYVKIQWGPRPNVPESTMLWKIHNWTELIQGQEMNSLDNYKMKLQETLKYNHDLASTRDTAPTMATWAQELATWALELV